MAILKMELLGAPKLCIDEHPCKIGIRKAEAMLYYSFFSTRPVASLYLCDLLWPNTEEKKARQNLNDAFYSLRKGLQDAQAPEAIVDILKRSRDGFVDFNRNCGYACDVEAFEGILSNATDKTESQTLAKALELYRGPFLENFSVQDTPDFEAWVTAKRQTLEGSYRKLLHLLSTQYLTQGNWPEAIKCLERLRGALADAQEIQREQETISAQEVAHGLLMICHALTYRLDLAAQVYGEYEQRHRVEAANGSSSSTLEKLHKIIQTYQPSNLRVRALVAEALQRISRRTMEPRLDDALLSVYMATGAQRAPNQGSGYRAVLLRAQEEAWRHGAALIGTPHVILALCEVTERDFPNVRNSLALSLQSLAQALSTILGQATTNSYEPTAYTLPLQRVLQVAADVAGAARADTIDVPHLWLALVKEEHSVLSQLLEQCGVDRLQVLEQMEEDLE